MYCLQLTELSRRNRVLRIDCSHFDSSRMKAFPRALLGLLLGGLGGAAYHFLSVAIGST